MFNLSALGAESLKNRSLKTCPKTLTPLNQATRLDWKADYGGDNAHEPFINTVPLTETAERFDVVYEM